jgi:hypothetical protein
MALRVAFCTHPSILPPEVVLDSTAVDLIANVHYYPVNAYNNI